MCIHGLWGFHDLGERMIGDIDVKLLIRLISLWDFKASGYFTEAINIFDSKHYPEWPIQKLFALEIIIDY